MNLAIQLARLKNDTVLLNDFEQHLERMKRNHAQIRHYKYGESEWESFCKIELAMTEGLLKDIMPVIETLSS